MAMYASQGVKITLVTCTRGEEGEVLVSELSHIASSQEDKLGEHREIELAEAMKIIGVADYRFLGSGSVPPKKYRDSGMMGTESNNRADVFWQANVESAAEDLRQIILEVKPDVLITYDESGGYGHPDHIQAHRVAMRGAALAAEGKSGWKIEKIYWNCIPVSMIERGIEAMKDKETDFFGVEKAEDFPFAKPDEMVTTVITGGDFVAKKMNAMKAHATQISVDGPFFALSNNLGLNIWSEEYYTLVHGEKSGPFNSDGRETDLFAGIGPESGRNRAGIVKKCIFS